MWKMDIMTFLEISFQAHSVTLEPEAATQIPSFELHLPVPDIEKHHSRTIQGGAGDAGTVTLEVENFVQCGTYHLHKLKLCKAGDSVWEQVLSSKIIATAGTR